MKNRMEEWLDRFPPPEDSGDVENDENDLQSKARRRARLLSMAPQAALDLHGYTSEEAAKEIRSFIKRSYEEGLEKVVIIHGKGHHSPGGGVLSKITAECVSKHPFAGENGLSIGKEGGRGSRWVILRQRSR
jgi:DNA-nicking Smr family endonuclease